MKHTLKITAILITMFFITQILGLWVINFYNQDSETLPYGMEPPESEISPTMGLANLFIAFAFAIFLFFLLTKIKAEMFIRLWFFLVTILAVALTLNVVFSKINLPFASLIGLVIAFPLAYFEIFKKQILILNINKVLSYSGIAVVFVFFLISVMETKAILGIIILLLAISLYDIWAVWKSEFMKNMATYQITKIGVFGGFFIPYADKKEKKKIKLLKQKYKNKSENIKEKAFNKAKIKVNLGILGGGDVVFPLITAGIFYIISGLIPAIIIILSAAIGLTYLNSITKKGKFYPAMPFLSIAMYIGMMLVFVLKDILEII